ncbi:MAG: gamma-glutamyl-gamma-aminobutyrate hydrolase family protein [Rickettsiales bacterium]|nr:gamma-glutamyl-gamma-aminobutyrate hydrolase family protein [Rickettsiales bacterium]
MPRTRPVIGFTLDHETKEAYSKLPWYAIRENYFTAVSRLGALPLGLPYELDMVDDYLNEINALLVIGGDFDIPPHLYGDDEVHDTVTTKNTRTQFEWAMSEGAIKRDIPVLGICGGQQLLNVVLGGTLIQHIPDAIENCLEHEQPNPRNEVGHSISVKPDTLLHRITGKDEFGVNSAHHQAARAAGKDCIVSAHAPDGVIEAIEYPNHPFCLGVQWHPEYRVTENDDKVMQAFVDAAAAHLAANP